MPLMVKVFTLGQMKNNTMVIYDPQTKKGYIVDPSFQNQPILDFVKQQSLVIQKIICTHAHFDHFAGVPFFKQYITPSPSVAIHQDDLSLWEDGGGSRQFNFPIQLPEKPDEFLADGQRLILGGDQIEVHSLPGHSPGSIILYIPSIKTLISGDTLFCENIGRTDFRDGDHNLLLSGIRSQILSLEDDVLVIPGHGDSTTVGHEKKHNPFFA